MHQPASPTLGARLFVAFQYVLPQHLISRVVGWATRRGTRWFKDALIRSFVRGFRPDMTEAVEPDPFAYPTFNAFFTRALRPGTRPVAQDDRAIACPVDGTVSECGDIRGDRLLQAKGHDYTLTALLGGDAALAARFAGGTFATIYLAPYNYHRIHMPLDGTLARTLHVPGRLFSVNSATAAQVPGLFARNERVVCAFEGDGLAFAVVLVGALNVGSMETVWHGEITPGATRATRTPQATQTPRATRTPWATGLVSQVEPRPGSASLRLRKGDEMARFNMGSTIVLLLPAARASLHTGFEAGRIVRMGQQIGTLHP